MARRWLCRSAAKQNVVAQVKPIASGCLVKVLAVEMNEAAHALGKRSGSTFLRLG